MIFSFFLGKSRKLLFQLSGKYPRLHSVPYIARRVNGNGAFFQASRILNEFRSALGKEKYLTFNPGLFVGGTTAESKDAIGSATGKENVVSAKVVVDGDLRFISEERKAAYRHDAGRRKQRDQVSTDPGFGKVEALDPGDRGAGDVAYISNIIPGLDGIGIGGRGNSHAKGEIRHRIAADAHKRAAILIYRLTKMNAFPDDSFFLDTVLVSLSRVG